MMSLVHSGRACAGEKRCAEILCAILQNVSINPNNRTRLYKAELCGALALQQELLGMKPYEGTGGEDDGTMDTHALLPPVTMRAHRQAMWEPKSEIASGDVDLNASLDATALQTVRPATAGILIISTFS